MNTVEIVVRFSHVNNKQYCAPICRHIIKKNVGYMYTFGLLHKQSMISAEY